MGPATVQDIIYPLLQSLKLGSEIQVKILSLEIEFAICECIGYQNEINLVASSINIFLFFQFFSCEGSEEFQGLCWFCTGSGHMYDNYTVSE